MQNKFLCMQTVKYYAREKRRGGWGSKVFLRDLRNHLPPSLPPTTTLPPQINWTFFFFLFFKYIVLQPYQLAPAEECQMQRNTAKLLFSILYIKMCNEDKLFPFFSPSLLHQLQFLYFSYHSLTAVFTLLSFTWQSSPGHLGRAYVKNVLWLFTHALPSGLSVRLLQSQQQVFSDKSGARLSERPSAPLFFTPFNFF